MKISEFDAFLNSSEHIYGLSHRDSLMLKKFCREEGYLYNSMIGGCESIRDIQESLTLATDALECPAIESEFAAQKLSSSIRRFCGEYDLTGLRIFINIGTRKGLKLLRDRGLPDSKWPMENNKICFMIDRRMLTSERINADDNRFEVSDAESDINASIDASVELILEHGHTYGISGGVTPESLQRLSTLTNKPQHIKSGLFTFCPQWEGLNQDARKLNNLQRKEFDLLMRMLNILNTQSRAIKNRCDHLYNYLVEG